MLESWAFMGVIPRFPEFLWWDHNSEDITEILDML